MTTPNLAGLASRVHETRDSSPKLVLLNCSGRIGRVVLVAAWVFLFSSPDVVGQSERRVSRLQIPFRDYLVLHDPTENQSTNANRYVSTSGSDKNDGTEEHPWATISHAGAVASPGMRIHVAPGSYVEAVVTRVSGTTAARIVYSSDEDWGAVISAPGRDGFAWMNTGNYTDIIGFEIAGNRCGGIGLGGSFQRAVSNHVHNTAAGCSTSDGGSGINDFDYSTHGNDIVRNYVHDIGIGEPLCGQFRHNYIQGVYQANANGHIDHNIVANNCGFGIHLWHSATHAAITNNTVVGNKAGGVLVGSGDAPCSTSGCPGGNDYTIVRNNIVAYNGNSVSGGWGISERSEEPGRTGVHNEYSNNLSFQNLSGDYSMPPTIPCKRCITGVDPQFVSFSSGDYRLTPRSPAVGSGGVHEKQGVGTKSSPAPVDIGALPQIRVSKE